VRGPLDRTRVQNYLASAGVDGDPPFASVHELPYDETVLDAEPSAAPLLDRPALSSVVDGLLAAVAAAALEASACAS
jgi:hypothetical protein